MSGIDILDGFKNLSNSRSYFIGSRSVINREYATAQPAAEPRPEPTLILFSRVPNKVPSDEKIR